MERFGVGAGFVESVVKGDSRSFAVNAMEQARNSQVGYREPYAITTRRC